MATIVRVTTTGGHYVAHLIDGADLMTLREGEQTAFQISAQVAGAQARLRPGGSRWRALAVALRGIEGRGEERLVVERVRALSAHQAAPSTSRAAIASRANVSGC